MSKRLCLRRLLSLVLLLGLLFPAIPVSGQPAAPQDASSPAPVINLSAVPGAAEGSAVLYWTAPGDDGRTGTAAAYEIRYNTAPLDDANWDSSTVAAGVPLPQPAGSGERAVVGGLPPGQRIYFAVKTLDEAGNAAPVSNIAAAVTGFAPNSLYIPAVANQSGTVTVIPATTEVLSSATTEYLELLSADGTFTFDRVTPELAALDPGDVMVGGLSPATPYGFLRKVSSVTQQNGALVVETEPAALEDAIQNGAIHMREQLTADTVLAASYADGVTLVASPDGSLLNFSFDDMVLYDKDKNTETTWDQVTASGSIAVDLTANFDYEIEWSRVKHVEFVFDVDEEVNLSAGWDMAYELNKSIPFADVRFNTITVMVGIVPVFITPEVSLALDVNGSVGAAIEVSASQTASLRAGGAYRDGQWHLIREFGNTFDFDLSPELEAGAQFKAGLNCRTQLRLYGVIIAYVKIHPYLELIATILPIKIDLYGGIDVTLGIMLKAFSWTLIDWTAPPWIIRMLLWSWPPANSPPTLPANPSPPDGAVDQPHAATLSWSGGDPDGDTVTYDIYFEALDPNPDLLASDKGGTSFEVSGLAPDTTYYWRIVAEDDEDATAAGPVWSFRTGADGPQPCDGRHATVNFLLDSAPDDAQDMRIWGPYGNFLLDNPAEDDGDGITDTWTYTKVLPGTHNFAVSVPFRWWFSGATCAPADNCQVNTATRSVVVTVAACENVTVTALVRQKGSLAVNSFEDRNGNGEQDEGEQRLSPWWSELTTAEPDGSTSLVASNFDGGSGTWHLFHLVPDRLYTVCQKPQDGYTNVTPGSGAYDERGWACYTFTLEPAAAAEAWFAYTAGGAEEDADEPAQQAGAGRTLTFRSVLDATSLFIPAVTRD